MFFASGQGLERKERLPNFGNQFQAIDSEPQKFDFNSMKRGEREGGKPKRQERVVVAEGVTNARY
jgi:hypothetical protein